MVEPRDRYVALLTSKSFNGVDFVAVDPVHPRLLRVHFINAVPVAAPGVSATITGGDRLPVVPVEAIDNTADWSLDAEGRPILALRARVEGDFSTYRLTVNADALDIAYASTTFAFRVNCPSDFDCAPAPLACPPDDTVVPPIDYLAKDFQSFRAALMDFSALRYPAWVERSEADVGVMFLEALSAVADDLSYYQDRVAAEATLETATQRSSLVGLARLVDYEPRPAVSATTLLQLTVSGPGLIAPGSRVFAASPDGGRVPFEVGAGLNDTSAYPVSDLWNFGAAPYWFDDRDQCWPAGATDLWLQGKGYGFATGQALLIQTDLPGDSQRRVVHLTAPGHEATDPIFGDVPVTRIQWRIDEALDRAIDLTRTVVGGNLVPATQGARVEETFAIGSAPSNAPDAALALARRGPNSDAATPNWVFRHPLGQSPLAWLAAAEPAAAAAPEISVMQIQPEARAWTFTPVFWKAESTDLAVYVDPVAWRPVAFSPSGAPTHHDIDGDAGATLRFGDGVFGAAPAEKDLFRVTYRVGVGAAGNVAVDTITQIDAGGGLIVGVRNPFPVIDGADAETRDHIARMAPQAFRAVQFRAVRSEDYQAAAESLPWVQKAGTSFRWTGSWLTVFTAVDPLGSEQIGLDQEVALVDLLNRRRLAGYESYAPAPAYVSLDLKIEVCAEEGWLDGDVEAAVLDRLGNATREPGSAGFFFADRFTFGTPLYRSRLEAAIQAVPGVLGVSAITYRRRGGFAGFVDLPETIAPSTRQILRVDNDPSWPERGTIRVIVEDGR